MQPIVIDVEASGFGRGSYPIEIGLVLADGTPHCYLITPARSWTHWDPTAERVHGISRDLLSRHGRSIEDVARILAELLRDQTVYSDAWSFDMSWLGKLYDEADLVQTFRVADLRELLDETSIMGWDAIKAEVASDLALRRHRASGDARILQETYRRSRLMAA